jgi:hypothetical protein
VTVLDPREPARAPGRTHADPRRRYPTACANCDGQFPGLSWQRYCSAACRKRASRLRGRQRRYTAPKKPPRPPVDRPPTVRPCVNCRRALRIAARGRCMACAQYLRRWGVDRPPEGFWHVERVCRTCGGPARPHRRAHGECHTCAAIESWSNRPRSGTSLQCLRPSQHASGQITVSPGPRGSGSLPWRQRPATLPGTKEAPHQQQARGCGPAGSLPARPGCRPAHCRRCLLTDHGR